MKISNFDRMIQLAEDIFNSRSDPNQLDVDESVIQRLQSIHPSTMSEHVDGDGPVAWILLIPTTLDLMNKFLIKEISEKELFEFTPLHIKYDALYLCSALVLEEYRGKGLAKKLTLGAIKEIRKEHPIKELFVWPFSHEGNVVAERLSIEVGLPLKKR